jgi:hypothetical protein
VASLWECFYIGVFLVKIMKRNFNSRSEKHPSKRHYLLLLLAIAKKSDPITVLAGQCWCLKPCLWSCKDEEFLKSLKFEQLNIYYSVTLIFNT